MSKIKDKLTNITKNSIVFYGSGICTTIISFIYLILITVINIDCSKYIQINSNDNTTTITNENIIEDTICNNFNDKDLKIALSSIILALSVFVNISSFVTRRYFEKTNKENVTKIVSLEDEIVTLSTQVTARSNQINITMDRAIVTNNEPYDTDNYISAPSLRSNSDVYNTNDISNATLSHYPTPHDVV